MNSQIYLQRLRHAMAHCDELEATVVEIQTKLESRREVLAETIQQLQQRLEKNEERKETDYEGFGQHS